MPRVAIIIPVFGHARELPRCLASIARQTFRDIEVRVVDDGNASPVEVPIFPTTRTLRRARNFPFPIRLLRQEHAGAPVARNLGARETDAELLLFCDADVVLQSDALARMVAALDAHPDASYAYSAFRFGWKRFRALPFDAKRLRHMPYIHTTSLIRRAHFPGFDITLARFQDWDLWLTMLARGHVGIAIPATLFTIRNMRGTMSRWVPAFVHRLPWRIARVRAYDDAAAVIHTKHHLGS